MSKPDLPRAVLDTNVFLRVILARNPNGVAPALWQCLEEGQYHLVTSPALLAELKKTLLVPELVEIHGWDLRQVEAYVATVEEIALNVAGTVIPDVPALAQRDPTDLPFVAAAVEAGAVIVTQDADLLDLAESDALPGTEILDPLAFLLKLRALSRDE